MAIRADFARRERVDTTRCAWRPSPQPEVERIPLDRLGEEVARATSLVRYAAGSHFPAHVHGGGEEILVLDGVFSDASGDYPAGFYLRNPPDSRHAPFTRSGCTLLVKLWQFAPDDSAQLRLDSRAGHWQPGPGEGMRQLALHRHGDEDVRLLQLSPGARWCLGHPGGAELLVLEGRLADDQGDLGAGAWLRLPCGERQWLECRDEARVFLKTGHLGMTCCWDLQASQG